MPTGKTPGPRPHHSAADAAGEAGGKGGSGPRPQAVRRSDGRRLRQKQRPAVSGRIAAGPKAIRAIRAAQATPRSGAGWTSSAMAAAGPKLATAEPSGPNRAATAGSTATEPPRRSWATIEP